MSFVALLLTLLFSLASVPLLVWMERRVAALIQNRLGPNRCNIYGFRLAGIIQSFADVIKLLFKQELLPKHITQRTYYLIAPSIVFMAALLGFSVIPYADANEIYSAPLQILPTSLGILWILAFAGVSVYGIIIGGWASNSKYALLGALRASAQVISYELAMALSLVSMLLLYQSTDLNTMVQAQSGTFLFVLPSWGIFMQPLAAVIFIITAFAETNRAPFDAPEGESEIVAGYHTEYGAMKFGLFFVAEYIAMALSSALIVSIFLGGYQLPYLSTSQLLHHSTALLGVMLLLLWVVILGLRRWIERNKQGCEREMKVYSTALLYGAMAISALIVLLLISQRSLFTDATIVLIVQVTIFTVKLFFIHFLFIVLRWTLPRFRYDQTQKLGWYILLPLAILNLFITAIIIVGV